MGIVPSIAWGGWSAKAQDQRKAQEDISEILFEMLVLQQLSWLRTKLRDSHGPLRARLAYAYCIGYPFSHCCNPKPSAEKEAEATKIALGILIEIKGVEREAETGFQIAQQDANQSKLRKIIGMMPTSYNCRVTAACSYNGAEAGEPIRESTEQLLDRCCLAQTARASEVNPETGETFAWIGWPAAFKEMATTMGTLFSEPRPALPPGRSPPK
jgi:hypothetical protein